MFGVVQQMKNKFKARIVMLTPDIMIDRRILIEAETLYEQGYEVYLLAGYDIKSEITYEEYKHTKIERINYQGVDERLSKLYKFQSNAINKLNNLSTKIDNKINLISINKNNIINNKINDKNEKVNNKSLYIQSKHSIKKKYNRFSNFIFKIKLKKLSCFSVLANKNYSINLKLFLKYLKGILIIKNKLIGLTARTINLCLKIYNKIFQKSSFLNGYEYKYYNEALKYRPDVIHVHDLPMLKVGIKLKRKLKKPLIYDMHEFYPEQDVFTSKQQKYLRHTEKKYIKFCDELITVNPMLGVEIKKTYGLEYINIIQNATIVDDGFYDNNYDLFREEFNLDKDTIIYLYQGWISEHRNLKILIEALPHIDRKITMIIMGYGEYKDELLRIAKTLNVEDKVLFVDSKSQEELLMYTSSADIGIIPYPFALDPNTKYASPNKLYEFIAARLPILSNNLPFVKSVIEKEQFGSVLVLENELQLAEAINQISFDEIKFWKSSLNIKGEKYLWKNERKHLIKIYEGLKIINIF